MNALAQAAISGIWEQATQPQELSTPDNLAGRLFHVISANETSITIETQGGSPITITRDAFIATVSHLARNGHGMTNPCEIRSHQHVVEAGPLCRAAREHNHGTRVINYIVPILESVGLVSVSRDRPNRVWLV